MDSNLGIVFAVIVLVLLVGLVVWATSRPTSPATAAISAVPQAVTSVAKTPSTPREYVLRDIKFLRQLISKLCLPEQRFYALSQRLDKLEARAERNSLQLAVIGEFNSGKSTLINAMLRQKLLKADNRATTAAATEIRYGSELRLFVKLRDGSQASGTESDTSALTKLLANFPRQNESRETLRQLIDFTTADPEVSRSVDALTIEVPATWLGHGICILDTPGIGAGAENASHHQAVTERVLSERADAAVILISAQSSVTKTLLDFMDVTVRPFLSRCIFIITKMDAVDPDEQTAVTIYIKNTLAAFLGQQPRIFQAGAQKVLLAAGTPMQEPNPWDADFVQLENQLSDAMAQQAPAIIAETLISLLNELMEELKSEVANKQATLKQQQQALEANSIKNLTLVLNGLHMTCRQIMDKTIARIKQHIEDEHQQQRVNAENAISRLIDGLAFASLQETVNTKIPRELSKCGDSLNVSVVEQFGLLAEDFKKSHELFISQFEQHYQNLKSLGIPQLHKNVEAITITDPSPRANSFMKSTPFENGPRWRDYALIAVFPDRTKSQVREAMMPCIRSYMFKIAMAWQARLTISGNAMKAGLKSAVDLHFKRYSQTVNAMIVEHTRIQAALANEQSVIGGYIADIDRRVSNLSHLQLQVSMSLGGKNGQSHHSMAEKQSGYTAKR